MTEVQQQQQVSQENMTADTSAARTSSEQPRPVEPMSIDAPRLRGGDGNGEAICCGLCAGLCCFECFECCC